MSIKNSFKIPLGVSDFSELTNPETNYLFVDKSLFIREILDDSAKVTLITRPRRWGKTLNLSMLQYFLAPTVLLKKTIPNTFNSLAIGQADNGAYLRYQGHSPVILLSFKDVKETQFHLALSSIRELLRTAFRQCKPYLLSTGLFNTDDEWVLHQYITSDIDQAVLGRALLILSEFLYRGFNNKEVYILIDEYDTPLNCAYQHGYLTEMTEFMKNLLSAAFKDNPYLQKGVMTGVLRVSKESMVSGLNNVEVHSVMSSTYESDFGFSDTEVSALFFKSGIEHDIESIRQYYNGYHIGTQACYNPWSIMQCLKNKGKLQSYWVNTADDRLLKNTLLQSSAAVKMELQMLIGNRKDGIPHTVNTTISDTIRFEDIVHNETAIWSLLLSTGYLTILDKPTDCFNIHQSYRLGIPNQEVQSLYIHIFQEWFLNCLTKPAYQLFMNDLICGRIDHFTQKLEQYLRTYASYHDLTRESNYHTFMLGLLCSLTEDYWLYSNVEAGYGRADIILVPRRNTEQPAIIMEFKCDKKSKPSIKNARTALQQIDTQKYDAFIARHSTIQKILKIGFVFNGKKVASYYQEINQD